jgi:multicomponent Na+:H+ antiporter subunit F
MTLVWLAGALALLLGFLPCGWLALVGSMTDRIVAAQIATVLTSLVLLLVAAGTSYSSFGDLALTLVVLSLPGTLVFAHFLERWL